MSIDILGDLRIEFDVRESAAMSARPSGHRSVAARPPWRPLHYADRVAKIHPTRAPSSPRCERAHPAVNEVQPHVPSPVFVYERRGGH